MVVKEAAEEEKEPEEAPELGRVTRPVSGQERPMGH
jgi:hypothetical protein